MKERSIIGGFTEYQDENTQSKLVEECVVEIEYINRNNYHYFRTIISNSILVLELLLHNLVQSTSENLLSLLIGFGCK